MTMLKPLEPNFLYRRCDPQELGFETTEELAELDKVIGQDRALAALHFGVGTRHDDYHLFALGAPEPTQLDDLIDATAHGTLVLDALGRLLEPEPAWQRIARAPCAVLPVR